MKVLVIDDNDSITDLMSKYITINHHECICTNDGRTGLSLINERKFDIILLDLAMPDFSGADVIDALCENGKIKDLKIILFTASAISEHEINSMIKKGVHSCLRKPIKMSSLMQAIEV